MIYKYITFSFSIVFISFIVGMIMTAVVRKSNFYNVKLSSLNFIVSDWGNKLLGVGFVKWVVKNTVFKYLNPSLKCDRKMNITDLQRIRSEMTKAEIDHLFAFVFVLIFVCVQLFNQKYLGASIMLLVNVLMNLNPSLLQQQNKRRIDKIINKFNA